MADDDDDDELSGGIDAETKEMLEGHVKEGKARKFVLITKGASIRKLIVFKKGPYGPKITQARKDGFRGEATCGVVTGKGVNLVFQLPGSAEASEAMKAEGNVYSDEPCKMVKLRAFMIDAAGLSFKPEFAIIRSAGEVASVEEADETREVEGTEAETQETVPTAPPQPEIGEDQQKPKLVEALKRMTPLIQKAVAAQPARKAELLAPAATIKEHLQSDRLEDAKRELLAYGQLLRDVLSSSGTATDEEDRTAWNEASAEFPLQRQRVATSLPDQLAQFDALVRNAQALAGQGKFQEALARAGGRAGGLRAGAGRAAGIGTEGEG
jgi:hypothetical protein